jgi:predicted DNA-binding protein
MEEIIMLSIRLPKEIATELAPCAKDLNISKSKIVNDALALYLEDLHYYIQARKVLAKDEPTFTHEELKHEFANSKDGGQAKIEISS